MECWELDLDTESSGSKCKHQPEVLARGTCPKSMVVQHQGITRPWGSFLGSYLGTLVPIWLPVNMELYCGITRVPSNPSHSMAL